LVEPIRVSHSIMDATALAIQTGAGMIVHSGDFKFDPAPSDGEVTDEARLAELGDAGVELLLSDSTNVDRTEHSGSEKDVAHTLDELIAKADARVFVALFASNVQRLISLGNIARERGRKLCLLGRSLQQHVDVARELGALSWPHDLILPVERARTYPRKEILLLASGTQAEPGSAMMRLSQAAHRFIEIQSGDTVIFSSRVIPGNDRQVISMMGDLLRLGANIESRVNAHVHTSGHASRPEQQHMIDLLRPRSFIPVHGTRHHLTRHAELARERGVKEVCVIENGQVATLQAGQLRVSGTVPAGLVHIELGGECISSEALRQRRDLGRSGLLSLGVLCDRKWRLRGSPSLYALGLPQLEMGGESLHELGKDIARHWKSFRDAEQSIVIDNLKSYVRTWAEHRFGLRPVVAVHVTRDKSKKDD
jgi:ribonuclease J